VILKNCLFQLGSISPGYLPHHLFLEIADPKKAEYMGANVDDIKLQLAAYEKGETYKHL